MRRSLLVASLFLTSTAVSVPHVSYAQDAVQRPAEIRTGSCASIGDSVVSLENVIAPGGDEVGPAGATPVEQSVTVVPQLLPDLLAGGFIVVVDKSIDEPGTPAACGVVGGVVAEDGTLAVGINPMEGSRLDGVAYFSPKRDDSGTTVTLLLVDNRVAEEASGPAGPVGMAGEKAGKGRQEGETSVDSASGEDAQEGQESADGDAGKEGKPSKDGKGGRGGDGGNGGNAGNDGDAAAGLTGGEAPG